MGGYVGAERLSHKAHGRLEANIALFGTPPNAIAIVSIDTLFAGPDLTAAILNLFEKLHGLAPERVLVLASHTHFAPMLDRTKPKLGPFVAQEFMRWQALLAASIDGLCVTNATQVTAGCGESDKSINRRLKWRLPSVVRLLGKVDSDIYTCDNPLGARDPRIRIFIYQTAHSEVCAILWSFACHPVGFPEPDTASADFVGVVRERLREKYGSSVPVIFAPGCMGDVRPRSPHSRKTLQAFFHCAIFGPTALPFSRSEWDQWANGLSEDVQAIADAGSKRFLIDAEFPARSATLPIAHIFDGYTPVPELVGKAVSLPGIGRITTLSCEPVTAIAEFFCRSVDDLVIGYEGDVFGYLPVDVMIAEGGYEVFGFTKAFDLHGHWKTGLDGQLQDFGELLHTTTLNKSSLYVA